MKILNADYVKGVSDFGDKKTRNIPEVCFIGRSNVGKSSMINTLLMRKIARTSSTPGATRMINLYRVQYESKGSKKWIMFSDFPGFGYSKVSKTTYQSWEKLIEGYVLENTCIRKLIWVFDVRRDMDALDKTLIEWIKDNRLDVSLVLTKADKESSNVVAKRKALFSNYVENGQIFVFSSKDGTGRKELLSHILSVISNH
jgi:GTP-binding protein